MKYLRRLLGHQVLVQLDYEGVALSATLDGAEADHLELVDVVVHSGRGGEDKPADGRMFVPVGQIVWVQLP